MSKIRYRYNTKTLSYEKAVTPIGTRLFRILSFLGTSSVIGVISVIIAFRYFDSPKERRLRREIDQMTLQYKLLNRRLDQYDLVLHDLASRDNDIYRAILETDSIPDAIRRAGFGGADRYKDLEGFDNSALMISLTQKVDLIAKEMYIQSKSYDDVIKLTKGKEKMLASIPAIMPIANKDLRHAPGGFGWRIHPIYKTPEFHPGMDFAAAEGTEIYATGDGVVTVADDKSQGYGWHVVINHGFGYETLYGHMSRMAVVPGQQVKRGQVIGYVGSTGLSTAPHCHYEVHKNGELMNPVNYYYDDLTPEQYQLLIKMAAESGQAFD
ncbi:MAG TPA: M23 family metallopeptidase [Bacteroidia bacterium]|nr:M23 family metallopeptidase [Bacteroidia bacterium]